MKNLRFWWIGLILSTMSILLVGGALQATETNQASPQNAAELNAVPNQISYQGVYTQNGNPVTGSRDMIFRFFNNPGCSGIPLQSINLDDVNLQNGLFHVNLDVNATLFNGSGRWLRVHIDGENIACERILPAPYALHSVSTGALHGHPVDPSDPSGGSFLSWTGSEWAPTSHVATNPATGTGSNGNLLGLRGHAIFPYAPSPAPNPTTTGVLGISDSRNGRGVSGQATAPTGSAFGVHGTSASQNGRGVFGDASASSGTNYGVYGRSSSASGRGVYGEATADSGTTYGVYGTSSSPSGRGVYGLATGGTGLNYGVYGEGLFGVYGQGNTGVTGIGYYTGVEGRATGDVGFNTGVYGIADHNSAYAGYFNGRVHVTGNFSAGGTKSFKIDHPLDPANQFLYHFALESPEVRNVYEGVATLDAQGAAEIQLPAYFSAVNTGDYRYQLTPIGAAMPNLHVAQEIEGNAFAIGGGEPGLRVSWQITAVRNDPYLRDHRPQAETLKSEEEIGRYLYPQGYGQPDSSGMDYERIEALEQSHE
jgi:hypothetical protein